MDIKPTGPSSLPPDSHRPLHAGLPPPPNNWVTNPTGNPENDFMQDIAYAVLQFEKELLNWFNSHMHCSWKELQTEENQLGTKWMGEMMNHIKELAMKGGAAYKALYDQWMHNKGGPVPLLDFILMAIGITMIVDKEWHMVNPTKT